MTAHQLDDDVGTDDERVGVGREQLARQVDVALRVDVADGDARQLEARARAVCEFVAVAQQETCDL